MDRAASVPGSREPGLAERQLAGARSPSPGLLEPLLAEAFCIQALLTTVVSSATAATGPTSHCHLRTRTVNPPLSLATCSCRSADVFGEQVPPTSPCSRRRRRA